MRYPNHFHENIEQPEHHEGEQPARNRHPRGHGRFHCGSARGMGRGMHPGMHRGMDDGMHHDEHCEQHQGMGPAREGHGPQRDGHEGYGQPGQHQRGQHEPGQHQRGDAHRRPTLERSIMKSARRIRRSDLTPEQLHRRIAQTVSREDYVTTLRTLRRIGKGLRPTVVDDEETATER